MAPTFSRVFTPLLEALWKLVRVLLGGSRRVEDAETGNGVPVKAFTAPDVVAKAPVPTYRPDTTGVPAFVLSSMVGAAFAPEGSIHVKAVLFPGAPMIPVIVITPPPADDVPSVLQLPGDKQMQPEKSDDGESEFDRAPLRAITNGRKRVHGKTPPKRRLFEKENIGAHPNAPRRPQPRIAPSSPRISRVDSHPSIAPVPAEPVVKTAEPGSSEWKREKSQQLEQARAWSDAILARRRSLPITPALPPVSTQLARRASAPARMPLADRLRLAVASCATPAPAPAVIPVAPLWGDGNVSFVLGDEEEAEEEEEVDVVRVSMLSGLPNTEFSIDAVQSQSSPLPSPSTSSTSLTASSSSSSSGSLSSILDAFEEEFRAPAWLGLKQFPGNGGDDGHEKELTDNESVYGGLYMDDNEDVTDDSDHWSDVVSLEGYA